MIALDRAELVSELSGLSQYARWLCGNDHDAQDLVQDTLVRALERGDSYRGDASLATWLHRVMYHAFVDRLRRDRRVVPVDDDHIAAVERAWQDDAYTVDAERVVARAEATADLLDALARLPYDARSAVLLHDAEGWTAAQVAQVQEVSLAAAKGRIRRGRTMLVSLLAGDAAPRPAKDVPMRCWDARSRVDDYLDDALEARERLALERHLAGCPTCPALYAGLVGVRGALGGLRDPDTVVAPEVARRLRAVAAGDTAAAGDPRHRRALPDGTGGTA